MINFELFTQLIEVDTSKKVDEIEIDLQIYDCTGEVNITDIMLQGGSIVTVWTGHPSELRWSHDY
jgi:hypothetical protein